MNYPFWDIPHLGSGWVIGLIAIFHVMISQFAVGGGLYLPMAERKAQRMTDPVMRAEWLKQLVNHSKFFLLLTGVFGTVSGVGIWFAIGLTHPEATSTLIHNFVFGWAMEWVFFLVELTTIAVYYSTWNRIDPKLHLKVGWVYAVASVFTLIIINGILTFMLTPGDAWLAVAGTGREAGKFWEAFFNPTYWPGLLLRVGVCTSLAGIWALITSSRIDGDKQPALKTSLVQWSVKWLMPSFVATPLLLLWYLFMVPPVAARAAHLGHRHHRSRHVLCRHPALPSSSSLLRLPSWALPTILLTAIRWSSISPTRSAFCCWPLSLPAPGNMPAKCSASPMSSAIGCIRMGSVSLTSTASTSKAISPIPYGHGTGQATGLHPVLAR